MQIDDVVVPDEISARVNRAAAALPDQVWDLDGLRKRAGAPVWRTWWSRNRRLAGIGATALATIVAGSVTVVAAGGGLDNSPEPDQYRVDMAFATDHNHLFAWRADCPDCYPVLFGSDDGGVTWSRRTDRLDWRYSSLQAGPGGLLVTDGYLPPTAKVSQPQQNPIDGEQESAVSVDGGRTWRPVVEESAQALPVAQILRCGQLGNHCGFSAIDPATNRVLSLSVEQRPALDNIVRTITTKAAIFLDGYSLKPNLQYGVPAVSVSQDGGRTWTDRTVPCGSEAECGTALVPGLDATTLYRVETHPYKAGSSSTDLTIQRSVDGGRTWRTFTALGASANSTTPSGVGPTPEPEAATGGGIVAPDGALIAFRFESGGGVPLAWRLGPTDTKPTLVRLAGLPDDLGEIQTGDFVTGTPDVGYLMLPVHTSTIYRSLDGITWHAVRVQE